MSVNPLTDEVWHRLDPHAARLDRRSRRALTLMVLGAAVLVVLIVLGSLSGLLRSRVDTGSGGGDATANSHLVTSSEHLINNGWIDERIDAVAVTTPGFRLISSHGAVTTITGGGTGQVSVAVRVLDCSQVTRTTDFSIQLRLHRFWGETTVTFDAAASGLAWDSCHDA